MGWPKESKCGVSARKDRLEPPPLQHTCEREVIRRMKVDLSRQDRSRYKGSEGVQFAFMMYWKRHTGETSQSLPRLFFTGTTFAQQRLEWRGIEPYRTAFRLTFTCPVMYRHDLANILITLVITQTFASKRDASCGDLQGLRIQAISIETFHVRASMQRQRSVCFPSMLLTHHRLP